METIHKGFCLYTLENVMKDWRGGSYLVMKSNTRVPDSRPVLAIGYTYNYRKVLGLISIEMVGSTKPFDPYLSSFSDIYFNVYVFKCL